MASTLTHTDTDKHTYKKKQNDRDTDRKTWACTEAYRKTDRRTDSQTGRASKRGSSHHVTQSVGAAARFFSAANGREEERERGDSTVSMKRCGGQKPLHYQNIGTSSLSCFTETLSQHPSPLPLPPLLFSCCPLLRLQRLIRGATGATNGCRRMASKRTHAHSRRQTPPRLSERGKN